MNSVAAISEAQNEERKRGLRSTYLTAPQFGLVLGAGVSKESRVPTYAELALRVLELASEDEKFVGSRERLRSFVEHQRALMEQENLRMAPPEEVVLFARTQLNGDETLLRKLVKKALYREVKVGRIVHRPVFENNDTLNAVLTFCAARTGTVLAPSSKYEVESNPKVGGILTTNYDNLVEGAFHTKYRRNLLKPVGRPSSEESERKRRVIPVYHVHGYIGYRETGENSRVGQSPDVVIAQDDYFRSFYHPLGFGNYIAMSFLRRVPCLFIGSQLTDANLRRFLFHLRQDIGDPRYRQKRFALLPRARSVEDEFNDVVLLSYGIETIWIDDFDEIPGILRDLYTAVGGVKKADWKYLLEYRWPKPKASSGHAGGEV